MKKYKKSFWAMIPIGIVCGILYFMFKDIYGQIWQQIKNTNPILLLFIILLGLGYMCLDAIPYKLLIERKLPGFTLWEAIKICFLGLFLNITTFGTGIKPGQTYVLNKKGIDVGNGFAMLTIPYIFHKLTIVLYATIVLLVNYKFIIHTYTDTYHYLYAGYGFSLLVISFLVVICVSSKIHDLIFYPLDRLLKKESLVKKKEICKNELGKLQKEAEEILIDRSLGVKIIVINLLKLTCWYCVPLFALYAVNAGLHNISIWSVLSTSSFMQLIVGVIPVTTGIGPTEVVYTLLYGVLFGKVLAGTTMLLYRFATYYFPFLLSIIVTIGLRKDIIKK